MERHRLLNCYYDNGVRFPIDEEITVKKALSVQAFRNNTKFKQFLKSCEGNQVGFSKKLLEEIKKRGFEPLLSEISSEITV